MRSQASKGRGRWLLPLMILIIYTGSEARADSPVSIPADAIDFRDLASARAREILGEPFREESSE